MELNEICGKAKKSSLETGKLAPGADNKMQEKYKKSWKERERERIFFFFFLFQRLVHSTKE